MKKTINNFLLNNSIHKCQPLEKLRKRKTVETVYGVIKTSSNRLVHYKITAPYGYKTELYPVLFEMYV